MLISDHRKFIFIHIYKNAGTSIRKVLRPYALPPWQAKANWWFKKIGIPQYRSHSFGPHLTAAQLVEKIGLETFKSYYSFAIVRNPWDWEVSRYKYILRHHRHGLHQLVTQMTGFDEYIRWRSARRNLTQQDFIDFAGKQIVDFVGRFESLDSDFRTICDRLGLHLWLPVRNSSDTRPYQEFYSNFSRKAVEQLYAADIERFGYEFGRARPVDNQAA